MGPSARGANLTAMKSAQKISPSASARTKPRKKHPPNKEIPRPNSERERGWMVAGFDTSMSSIAGAAIGYDKTLNRFRGPAFTITRWSKEDQYLDRLKQAAMSYETILDLQHLLGISLRMDEVFIAQEEPFPPHGQFMARGTSGFLKQQAEISGAFLGGLMRYGFKEVWQVGNHTWRKVIADMLSENGRDITIHHTKWKDPALCEIYNCKPADTGKFRSKQWAFDQFGISPVLAQLGFPEEIPDWPDLIHSAKGHVPRPEGSSAKAFQCDDGYDALAVMWALYTDLEMRGQISQMEKA